VPSVVSLDSWQLQSRHIELGKKNVKLLQMLWSTPDGLAKLDATRLMSSLDRRTIVVNCASLLVMFTSLTPFQIFYHFRVGQDNLSLTHVWSQAGIINLL
jgi:hypothetical protein